MFNKLKPQVRSPVQYGRRQHQATSVAGRLYEKAMENAFTTREGRRPEYRPSSFPLCSVLVYMRLIKGASLGYFEENRSTSGDFFSGVGTYAHENIQFHMGFSGKVFGDWKCKNIQCKKGQEALSLVDASGKVVRRGKLSRKNSCNNRCSCCGSPMEYIEKEINYKGLKGHIDCIIRLDDGRYWVSDYKTCTKNKIDKRKWPQKAHLKQLPSYCYVLEKKYKMKIAGFSLLYFSRDNPFYFAEHSEKWDSKWRDKCRSMIKEERRKFKSGVVSFKRLDPELAIKHKPCKTLSYYESEICYYNECPMLDVCFNSRKLRKALDEHKKAYPTKKKVRQELIEAIRI